MVHVRRFEQPLADVLACFELLVLLFFAPYKFCYSFELDSLGFGVQRRLLWFPGEYRGGENMYTWTPKVCQIMASMAILIGFRLLFYILLGFR